MFSHASKMLSTPPDLTADPHACVSSTQRFSFLCPSRRVGNTTSCETLLLLIRKIVFVSLVFSFRAHHGSNLSLGHFFTTAIIEV